MDEKPLYEDEFLTIGEWLNSATVQLILGCFIAVLLLVFVHWIASVVMIAISLIGAFASYLVVKK